MNLLLFNDIYRYYFDNVLNNPIKDELGRFLVSIFDNFIDVENENKIVLSKHLAELLEIEFNDVPVYKEFIKHLLDSGNYCSVKSGNDGFSLFEELNHINKILGSYSSVLCINRPSTQFVYKNLAVYNERLKPNNHWMFFELARYSKFSLRYIDINTPKELNNVFDFIFALSEDKQYVVFDRNCNFEGDLFIKLRNHKRRIYYYTFAKNRVKQFEIFDDANEFFRSGVKVYTTNDLQLIHERRIFFGNFVMDIDEDFWGVNSNKTTWKLDLENNGSIVKALLLKRSQFSEVIR
ncbi:hypothetical protein [Rufibacter quisquiliarum]|uniref:Uncharacterized protein n=1 Tax=Rufibacter quisquiliarum TaxID=1549639 RepID=A0A839GS07_9BACT|nr:hypothetical protein [Rufibacter quisquiliarum]MBA9077208.1 hypothetical protein [Rufibacter quisquiliarum]